MPLKTLGPIGPRAVGERVNSMFCTVHNIIHLVSSSAEFSTFTVVSANGTLFEDKMRTCKSECAQLSFSKCPIDTHGGAGAKFSTNSHETGYSAV
jgi:hypothetical protein